DLADVDEVGAGTGIDPRQRPGRRVVDRDVVVPGTEIELDVLQSEVGDAARLDCRGRHERVADDPVAAHAEACDPELVEVVDDSLRVRRPVQARGGEDRGGSEWGISAGEGSATV